MFPQQLAIHLVSTYLCTADKHDDISKPSVFVISPPSAQTMLSVAAMLDQRLQTRPGQTRPTQTALLSRIQLLQYLSLDGLTESLGDVSASLHASRSHDQAAGQILPPTILLLQGFSSMLSDTNRRSGAIQTATLATNICRSLTHLSRTFANLLILVELDLEGRGTTASPSSAASTQRVDSTTGLSTAFTSQHGQTLSLLPAITLVINALDGGVDTLVTLHDAFGKTRAHDKQEAKKGPNRGKTLIVEVLKDRTGSKTGEWCLWVH